MPSIPLHKVNAASSALDYSNALPTVLHTPTGLAILEIQGTIHASFPDESDAENGIAGSTQTQIGSLEFPLYNPKNKSDDTKWMKRVYLYVGKHQRLTGEIKKLPKPLVAIAKRSGHGVETHESLDILDVIEYKILFGGRPEPVGE